MAKKKPKPAAFAVCGQCMNQVDMAAVNEAIESQTELLHDCGKLLVAGRKT